LLEHGFFEAARRCLFQYYQYSFETPLEVPVKGSPSKVDYVVTVEDKWTVLCEAKSPSIMLSAGDLLPQRGVELNWVAHQTFIQKLLLKVSFFR
jgi:hypothetical protein